MSKQYSIFICLMIMAVEMHANVVKQSGDVPPSHPLKTTQALLLKKIEELTLYIIEMKKKSQH